MPTAWSSSGTPRRRACGPKRHRRRRRASRSGREAAARSEAPHSTSTSSRAACSPPADADLLPRRARPTPPTPCSPRCEDERAMLVAAPTATCCGSTSACRATRDGLLRACDPFSADLRAGRARATRSRTRPGSQAMLEAERALANAQALAGAVPADAAAAVADACDAALYDVEELARAGPRRGQPRRAARARAPRASRRAARRVRAPRRDEPGHPRHGRDARRARARCRLVDDELAGAGGRVRAARGRASAAPSWPRARCCSRRCRRRSATRRRAGSSGSSRRVRGWP